MRRAWLIALALSWPAIAQAQTDADLPRMHEAVVAACPLVTTVRLDLTVAPPSQQACADPVLAAMTFTPAALDSYNNQQERTGAKAQWTAKDRLGKTYRCLANLLLDELNILRAAQAVVITTFTFDPASIANGAGQTSANVTVTGAQIGDTVDVAAPYSLQGLTATAYVSAANTAVVRLENQTGAAVNLASGTWGVAVRRPAVLAPRTMAQVANAFNSCVDSGTND